jgi:hypothetical protein
MNAAEWLENLLASYGALGVLFAAVFVKFGVHRLDPIASSSTAGFRMMIVPGTIALWPVLLRLWLRKESQRQ